MPRKLPSIVDGFMRYTDGKGSPAIYRKWAAIFTIASVIERKQWIVTAKGVLYPALYTVLVGPAGIGKSLAVNTARELLAQLRTEGLPLHVASTSVTAASLIDELNDAERHVIRPLEGIKSFHYLSAVVNEFGVFLPSWDAQFMSTITDLWDGNNFSQSRRTSKIKIDMKNAQLSLFSATTPAHLTNLLPEGAWEQGFMSRVLLIFSDEEIYTDLFNEFEFEGALWKDLVNDLKHIFDLFGERKFTDEAKEAARAWAKSGGDLPNHPKLVGYNARRAAHLLKLCLIASVASSDEKFITVDHFAEALDWMIEAEQAMPDIFKSMRTGGDARAIEECWHFAYSLWIKKKEPILEHRLIHFLQERVAAHSVDRVLQVMERAKLLDKKFTDGGTGYVPKPPSDKLK